MQNRTQLDRIVQEIIRQVEAGKEYLTQLGSLTSGVVKTASELQATANILKTSNVSLINSVNNLVTPAKSLSEQQAQLLDAVQKSVGLLQNTATSINGLATKQQTMSENLAQTLDTLTLTTENFATLGQEQKDLVGQHANFLQQIQEEHKQQGNLAVLLSDATNGATNVLNQMNNGAINLRSIAVSMNDLMRLQASMVSNPGMPVAVDLSNITRSYENTAQSMENVSKTLTVSAFAIQKASQQLRDVLDVVQQTTARRP
jgi:chromosome segregation ATPase